MSNDVQIGNELLPMTTEMRLRTLAEDMHVSAGRCDQCKIADDEYHTFEGCSRIDLLVEISTKYMTAYLDGYAQALLCGVDYDDKINPHVYDGERPMLLAWKNCFQEGYEDGLKAREQKK